MPEYKAKVFNRRIDRGEVATAPRNFMTSPPKKGNPNCFPGTDLSPRPKYGMGDDYDAMKKKEFAEH